jgi:hypothetical protein
MSKRKVELFVVLPYRSDEPWVPIEFETIESAVERADDLCLLYDGTVVFSVLFDPVTFYYGPYKVVRTFGKVPEDLVSVI